MRSMPAFLAVAIAMTLTPGPAFALLLQVSARDGWAAAMANIAGNAVGVLAWAALSAAGVSALVTASRFAYDALHYGGAAYLVALGVRALGRAAPARPANAGPSAAPLGPRAGLTSFRKGAVNSLANPKLAVFFVSLFPAFVPAGHAILPAAMAMAGTIVVLDFAWYGTVAYLVDRLRRGVADRLLRRLQRVTGVILVAAGVRVATAAA